MLTGKQIAGKGIITNFLEGNIQQQGIDLRLRRLFKVSTETIGRVPKEGKTVLPQSGEIDITEPIALLPGYYEVEFEEGCDVKPCTCMKPLTRSSVIRCGGEIRSGLFDAGFHTDHIGGYLKVEVPFEVERGSRLAQAVCLTSDEVENLYNGQFQGDEQREAVPRGIMPFAEAVAERCLSLLSQWHTKVTKLVFNEAAMERFEFKDDIVNGYIKGSVLVNHNTTILTSFTGCHVVVQADGNAKPTVTFRDDDDCTYDKMIFE